MVEVLQMDEGSRMDEESLMGGGSQMDEACGEGSLHHASP